VAQHDLVVIASPDESIFKVARLICQEFNFNFGSVEDVEAFADSDGLITDSKFIICSGVHAEHESEVAGQIQVIKQLSPQSYIVVVLSSKMTPENAEFVKKSGANLVIMENEIDTTSKLEFVVTQKLKASYLPVKVTELVQGTHIACSLFHLLPMNRKFLPVIQKNQEITEARLEKIKAVGEVYVRREDLAIYSQYTDSLGDPSAKGLARRCRAQFLNLTATYTDLVLMILDQSEVASFDLGRQLYSDCQRLATDLMTNLGAVGDAWEIVNHSAVGGFGSVERGPAIAAYAGLLSLQCDIGKPEEVMIAALLADVGLLELSPRVLRILRARQLDTLTGEDLQSYQHHPLVSLNRALARRLPMSEAVKAAIMASHERADGKGFPNRFRADKVPAAAQLIQLSELIDRASMVRMGETRPSIMDVKKQVLESEYQQRERFNLDLLAKVRDQLLGSPK